MHFKQNCAYKDNQGNFWFVNEVDRRLGLVTAAILSFERIHEVLYLTGGECIFDLQTGVSQIKMDDVYLTIDDKEVLDYNIEETFINKLKIFRNRICTRPARFKKFDKVFALDLKEPGIIITKDDLDNEFLVYYPGIKINQWEVPSRIEFMYKPVKYDNQSN